MNMNLRNFFFLTVPSLLLILIVFELVFRFIIPAAVFPYYYYDHRDRILKFDVSYSTTGIFTIGKFAQQRAKWHINNMGWKSDIDYTTSGRSKPLIAIVGDSYVEAFQVDQEKNIAAKLQEMVQEHYDVYSFGISGSPLSHYLQMSRYINKYFNPEILVFIVVHNDFSESLCSVQRKLGRLCLDEVGDEMKEGEIIPFRPSRAKRTLMMHSSVLRYIWANLEVKNIRPTKQILSYLGIISKYDVRYNANINVKVVKRLEGRVVKAVSYILTKIRKENEGEKIIFLMDAPREDIYQDTVKESDVLWLNKLMHAKCRENGFGFVDLTYPFYEIHKTTKQRFESEYDYHWNEFGHKEAARALFKKLREIEILSPEL
jgi:hypothetical protein